MGAAGFGNRSPAWCATGSCVQTLSPQIGTRSSGVRDENSPHSDKSLGAHRPLWQVHLPSVLRIRFPASLQGPLEAPHGKRGEKDARLSPFSGRIPLLSCGYVISTGSQRPSRSVAVGCRWAGIGTASLLLDEHGDRLGRSCSRTTPHPRSAPCAPTFFAGIRVNRQRLGYDEVGHRIWK